MVPVSLKIYKHTIYIEKKEKNSKGMRNKTSIYQECRVPIRERIYIYITIYFRKCIVRSAKRQ